MEPPTETTASVVRPLVVTRAVQLIALSLLLGMARAIFDVTHQVSGLTLFFALMILLIVMTVFFFLAFMIGMGRNWARIVLLILIIIGLPVSIPGYLQELRVSLWHGVVSFVVATLQVIAIVLLFTKPANAWFKARK
jgi:hypothetical protein